LAVRFLQKAVLAQPNNPDPYFQLGQAYQELNEHEQAIEALRKAIAYNPNLAHNKSQVTSAHHRLAQSLLKLGQTEEGRKELQEAADLKAKAFKLEQQSQANGQALIPEAATDRLGLADQRKTEGKDLDDSTRQELQNSEVYYQKVIGRAHNNIGLLRAERNDVVTAAEQFALAAKWDPQQEGVNYNLGLANFKAQFYKRAVSPLESELKINPTNRPARVLLGLVQFRLGSYAKASESLSSLIDQQSSDANLYYYLAASLIRQRKIADAEKVIEQMKMVAGDSPQFHLLMAEKNYSLGNNAQSIAEIGQALIGAGSTPLIHYYSGLLYLNLRKSNEAIREFESELILNPNDVEALCSLGKTLVVAGSIDRGLKVLRQVIQARPDHVEARYALGKTLLQKGDLSGAIQNLEQASQLDPDNAEVHYELGRAYLAAGRKGEGKTHIDISDRLKRSRAQTPGN
jgi:tetratricopeptide (TPR) repeat protein